MTTDVILPIVVIVALVIANGVFVAAEFALVGARRSRLETLAGAGNRAAAWLVLVFDRPAGKDGYIAIAQLGITLASIGLGMYGEPAVAKWLYGPLEDLGLSNDGSHTVGFIIALSGITFLHVVFGEMIPKALALQAPEQVGIRVNPMMQLFGLVFRPMVRVLNTIAFAMMRLLRIPEPDAAMSLYTSSELSIVTDEAADSGELGAMQRELIRNIFDLDDRTAEELMTSRSRLEVVDVDAEPASIVALIEASPRSRYPVIDGDLDHVVGVLHIKDFMRAHQEGRPLDLATLVRPLPTVVASTSAEELLEHFKRDRRHASLVADEFGGTIGLVTLDDIISEVMDAEVADGSVLAVQHDDGSLSLDGETTLAELEDDHGLTFHDDRVTTLAGLVLAEHGTVPPVGSTVRVQGHDLIIEESDGMKLSRIRVRRRIG